MRLREPLLIAFKAAKCLNSLKSRQSVASGLNPFDSVSMYKEERVTLKSSWAHRSSLSLSSEASLAARLVAGLETSSTGIFG